MAKSKLSEGEREERKREQNSERQRRYYDRWRAESIRRLGTHVVKHNFEHLASYLIEDVTRLEPGLVLTGTEVRTDVVGRHRIDIAAYDSVHGEWVIIEAKEGLAGQKAVWQVLGYMAEVPGVIHKDDRGPVRGVLIAGAFTGPVLSTAPALPNLKLMVYGEPTYRFAEPLTAEEREELLDFEKADEAAAKRKAWEEMRHDDI